MNKLIITLKNPKMLTEKVSFSWQVLDTPPAMFWFKLISRVARTQRKYFSRFTGFLHPHKTMKALSDDLNLCIDIINNEGLYYIKERAGAEFNQEFSNAIHHHFEILARSWENPSDVYRDSSPRAKSAISGLNQYIHDMETLHRAMIAETAGTHTAAALILECLEADRFKLPEDFLGYFTPNINFGDIVLHYSQIGKTWWEVFNDKDKEIFPNAILPLSVISGEMDVFFYDFKYKENFKKEFTQFLIDHGQDPQNKALALGYLPVAKFLNEQSLTQSKIVDLVSEHFSFEKVSVYKDDELIGEIFADTTSYNFKNVTELR